MIEDPMLLRIKDTLQGHYATRLEALILYGAPPDQEDTDLLCVLNGAVNVWMELDRIVDLTTALKAAFPDRPFQIMPCSLEDYESGASGLIRLAQRDGAFL